MPQTDLEGVKISYTVRESNEASNARIDFNRGSVKVVIPEDAERDPEAMLQEKKNWVLRQKREFNQFKRQIPDRSFEEGERFPFLGDQYPVTVNGTGQEILDNEIRLSERKVENSGIKTALEDFYREKAKEIFPKKVDKFREEVTGAPGDIYIRDQKTRWGSCTDKQNLNFNWRLLMAPEHVVDYVVVHELVHLDIKTHDQEFWEKVSEIYPRYRESNLWLEEKSARLVLDQEDIR
ncbi:MAG: M48 family metallopeptidase [Candidatus Nanohaloarchaea archaeon]